MPTDEFISDDPNKTGFNPNRISMKIWRNIIWTMGWRTVLWESSDSMICLPAQGPAGVNLSGLRVPYGGEFDALRGQGKVERRINGG